MNTQLIIESVTNEHLKTDVPRMDIGDTVNIHCRIIEGDKERIQIFQGVLIARRGRGMNEMITVRRIVDNQGVERMFPVNSPRIAKFEVVRQGDARRAKLYYLRERVGKKRRLRDRRRGLEQFRLVKEEPKTEAPAPEATGAAGGGSQD
ncbi:MAG: 50S ribosomal protein L19 [Phycisphaerales bacterium]|nr:MAG: 50S ribosomal protein L19 [Phycisphaerales bacterium]